MSVFEEDKIAQSSAQFPFKRMKGEQRVTPLYLPGTLTPVPID